MPKGYGYGKGGKAAQVKDLNKKKPSKKKPSKKK